MRLVYLSWLPTFHCLPFETVPDELRHEIPEMTIIPGPNPRLSKESCVAGVRATIELYSSGLFTVISAPQEEVPQHTFAAFGREAQRLYGRALGVLHVHLSSHRLTFFPVLCVKYGELQYDDIVRTLSSRYYRELLEQQQRFDTERSYFVSAVRVTARRLLSWKALLPLSLEYGWRRPRPSFYILTLSELLGRRVNLARVSETLSNCRAAGSFFDAFRQLHSGADQKPASPQYQEAHATLAGLYSDYGQLIGIHMLQATSLFVMLLGVLVGFVSLAVVLYNLNAISEQWVRDLLILVIALVAYVLVYFGLVRRVAERYSDATEGVFVLASPKPGGNSAP